MSAKPYRIEGTVWLKPLRTGRLNMNWTKVSFRNLREYKDQLYLRAKQEWPSHQAMIDITTRSTGTSGQIYLDGQTEAAAKFGLNEGHVPPPVPAVSLFEDAP